MGHTGTAVCDGCSYEAQYAIGGTRKSFTTDSKFPVSCRQCRAVTSANVMQSPLKCPDCGSTDVTPFSAAGMSKGEGGRVVERWGDLTLEDDRYRCPACGQLDLRFGRGLGMFFD